MWPWTDWKLRRALRRYRRERDLEAVLQMDWHRDLDLSAFFTDVEERLHGEEITRLRQKQAEYLALQNQINPHFLYNALEAIRTTPCWRTVRILPRPRRLWRPFSDTPSPMSRSM